MVFHGQLDSNGRLIKDTFNNFSRTWTVLTGHWILKAKFRILVWMLDFKKGSWLIPDLKWFFGIKDIGLVGFPLDDWIRLISAYQSTSDTKVYPQANVNKSRNSQFHAYGIYGWFRIIGLRSSEHYQDGLRNFTNPVTGPYECTYYSSWWRYLPCGNDPVVRFSFIFGLISKIDKIRLSGE